MFAKIAAATLCIASTLLAGCGIHGNSIAGTPQVAAGSRISRLSQSGDLLYASAVDEVFVFSYPAGKLVQTLSGFYQAAGLCTDASGNVFVTNELGVSIEEFAHGGTIPIALLWDYGQMPDACAVDPVTGNLAVADSSTVLNHGGSIAIYHKAHGWPTYVEGKSGDLFWFCTYDDAGNLFYDLQDQYAHAHLMELRRGKHKPYEIHIDKKMPQMGTVQWDGKHVTLGDPNASVIYRLSISGTSGRVVGTSRFAATDNPGYVQYTIYGADVVIPFGDKRREIGLWKYPVGGTRFKTISRFGSDILFGTTVSPGSSR